VEREKERGALGWEGGGGGKGQGESCRVSRIKTVRVRGCEGEEKLDGKGGGRDGGEGWGKEKGGRGGGGRGVVAGGVRMGGNKERGGRKERDWEGVERRGGGGR